MTDLSQDVAYHLTIGLAVGIQQPAVPERMQVGALAIEGDLDVVAAAVAPFTGVQGLVNIADQVDHPLERDRAVRIGPAMIGEDGDLGLQRGDDAVVLPCNRGPAT